MFTFLDYYRGDSLGYYIVQELPLILINYLTILFSDAVCNQICNKRR